MGGRATCRGRLPSRQACNVPGQLTCPSGGHPASPQSARQVIMHWRGTPDAHSGGPVSCAHPNPRVCRSNEETEGESEMSDRLTIPVLPLRDVVLFPGVTAPIGAGRPMTIKAIEAALASPDKYVFAVAQRENVENVTAEGLHSVGTIARIGQMQRGMSGMQLLLHGERRAMTMHVNAEHGHLVAVVRPLEDLPPINVNDPSFVALHKELRARSAELGQKSGLPEEVVQQVLNGIDDPGRFSDLVAGYLDLDTAQRQELLETLAVDERLRRVLVHVQRQISVLDAQEDIKNQVQEELGERQREVYLREQLKTIRRELGDEDDA